MNKIVYDDTIFSTIGINLFNVDQEIAQEDNEI